MIRRASLGMVAATMVTTLLARAAAAQDTSVPPDASTSRTATSLPPGLLVGIGLLMVPLVATLFVLVRYRRAMH